MAVLPTIAGVFFSLGRHLRLQMSSCHFHIRITNNELKLERTEIWGGERSKNGSGSALSAGCASPHVFGEAVINHHSSSYHMGCPGTRYYDFSKDEQASCILREIHQQQ
jgi:hypothetical protein